jgi:hypothetical protein
MRRRELLKALATVPVASALGNCLQYRPTPTPTATPSKEKIYTVQILLEGAFAVVLQKNKPNRLVAFVPRAEEEGHGHNFYFNDLTKGMPQEVLKAARKEPEGMHFRLSEAGLRNYPETYVNPGFADFEAYTQKWHLPDRVVTLELPFPNSINFSGRPLRVEFTTGRSGHMPTNYILEYYVEEAEKVTLTCPQLGEKCVPSPNCPPGVKRYFFGVAPTEKENPKHAVEFYNSTIRRCFPDLCEHLLAYIEPSEKNKGQNSGALRPKLMPSVLNSDLPSAHLLRVSAVLDCQSIGPVVHTGAAPTN